MTRQSMRVAGAPTPNDPKHGELSPASLPTSLAAPRTSVRTQFHETYDPRSARRCSQCGATDRWRQIAAIGGGWCCCPSREVVEAIHAAGDMAHTCSPSCILEVAG